VPVIDSMNMYEQTKQCSKILSVEDYAPLVKRIAQHMMLRMPASVQLDDLIQAGMIGLLEASKKYDEAHGASFETYAGIRIRGAIIDEMRRGDWVPRSVHRNSRRIHQAIADVELRKGRSATSVEIAEELEVDINQYHAMSQDAMCGRLFSMDESFDGEEPHIQESADANNAFPTPHAQTHKEFLKVSIADAILGLPEKEQMVLSLYYTEELNLKEIGLILNESRVSQIHSQATLRLRSRLQDWL
jgi:RNA polymerase sigma factor for flagellar operon FliA